MWLTITPYVSKIFSNEYYLQTSLISLDLRMLLQIVTNIVTVDNEFQGNELTVFHLRVQTTCSNVHFNTRWEISRKSSQYLAGNFKPISRSEDKRLHKRLQCWLSSITERVLLIPCSPERHVRRDTHVSVC